jgi:hypothetical protein
LFYKASEEHQEGHLDTDGDFLPDNHNMKSFNKDRRNLNDYKIDYLEFLKEVQINDDYRAEDTDQRMIIYEKPKGFY